MLGAMKKFLIVLTVFFLFAIGTVFYLIRTLDLESIQKKILAEANQQLAPAVLTAGPLEISGLSGLALRDVKITLSEREALKVGSLKLSLDLGALIDQKVRLSRMTLSDAAIYLWKEGELWNLQKIAADSVKKPDGTKDPRRLSKASEDPNPVKLIVDAFRLERVKIYLDDFSREQSLVEIEADGLLNFPELKITKGRLLRGQNSSLPFLLNWDLKTQAGLIELPEGSLFFKELLPPDSSDMVPDGQVLISGKIEVADASPQIGLKITSPGFSLPQEMGEVEPFEFLVQKDTLSGRLQVKRPNDALEADLKVSSLMTKRLVDGTVLRLKSDLSGYSEQIQGKLGSEIRLMGTAENIRFEGKVFSDGIHSEGLAKPLQPAIAIVGEATSSEKRVLAQIKGRLSEGIGQLQGSFDLDLKKDPEAMMEGIELVLGSVPASLVLSDLVGVGLQKLQIQGSRLLASVVGEKGTRIEVSAGVNVKSPLYAQDLTLRGQAHLGDFARLLKSRELPPMDGLFLLEGGLSEPDGLELNLKSSALSVKLTPGMAPITATNLVSTHQLKPLSGVYRLAMLGAQIFGGNVKAQGFMQYGDESMPNGFQAQAQSINLQEMASLVDPGLQRHFEGRLNVNVSEFKILTPLNEPRPFFLKGQFAGSGLNYYWHQTVADMIDGIEAQIRQKFLGNLLAREETRARQNVRFTSFKDMKPAGFELLRSQLEISDLVVEETQGDFLASSARIKVQIPQEEPQLEGRVEGEIQTTLSNRFLKEKIPMLKDAYQEHLAVVMHLNGPFEMPISEQEKSRIQREATATLVQNVDLGKAENLARSAVEGVKSFFRGGDGSTKSSAQEAAQGKLEEKLDQSLRGVEKYLGTTETQKIEDKIKNKIGEGLFKLFR